METLLSLAFDNLSSFDQSRIRKGLRQVEGLFAQICLSTPQTSPSEKRRSVIEPDKELPPPRALTELSGDPAFCEYFKLQNNFQWNVTAQLLNSLDRLLSKNNDGANEILIIQTLDLIQGTLLVHPPSRGLFSREVYMNHLLDLLEPDMCPAVQSATIITLVCALIECPQNSRTFERLDGLLMITGIFKSRETTREVKLKSVEFLYFYLMPETPSIPSANATISVPAVLQRSPSKLAGAFNRTESGQVRKRADSEAEFTKTTEEKQVLLSKHLHNVEDLVVDLREAQAAFGGEI